MLSSLSHKNELGVAFIKFKDFSVVLAWFERRRMLLCKEWENFNKLSTKNFNFLSSWAEIVCSCFQILLSKLQKIRFWFFTLSRDESTPYHPKLSLQNVDEHLKSNLEISNTSTCNNIILGLVYRKDPNSSSKQLPILRHSKHLKLISFEPQQISLQVDLSQSEKEINQTSPNVALIRRIS